MAEQEGNILHTDVDVAFEKAKRMLFGYSVACEKCGSTADEVDGYEYPKSKKRVMLCRQHARDEGFCYGCNRRFEHIARHMPMCKMVASVNMDERHEAALDWVETRAGVLVEGWRTGSALAIAVAEAYKAYVKDDLYPDEELARLEAAIEAYAD